MKDYSVYNAIQQLKAKGFKKVTVARQLDINRRTVDRYWDVSVDEYEARHSDVRRKQSMDEYQKTIIDWLTSYPSLSSAQVCDWLKENYDAYFSERTVSYLLHNIITKNCRAKWRILHLQNGENCRGYSDHQAMKNPLQT